MTRDKLLEYIADKHKAALKKAGVEPTDTQETLFFVLNDAMGAADAATQKAIADREVAVLINDKKAAMGVVSVEVPAPEEVGNVGN